MVKAERPFLYAHQQSARMNEVVVVTKNPLVEIENAHSVVSG